MNECDRGPRSSWCDCGTCCDSCGHYPECTSLADNDENEE